MDGSADRQGVSAGPPPAADPQDPLPESNWTWRRILVLAGEVARTAALAYILWVLAEAALSGSVIAIKFLHELARLILLYGLIDRLLYLVAPSFEQIIRAGQLVAAVKAGLSFRSVAKAEGPAGSAVSDLTAGPAAPAVPATPAAAPKPATHVAASVVPSDSAWQPEADRPSSRDPWEPQP